MVFAITELGGKMLQGFIGALGIILIICAISIFFYRWYIMASGIEVIAIVIKTDTKPADAGYKYFPVFQYSVAGKQFETKLIFGYLFPKYSNGAEVRIFCDRRNPKRIIVPRDINRNAIAISLLVLGLIIIGLLILDTVVS